MCVFVGGSAVFLLDLCVVFALLLFLLLMFEIMVVCFTYLCVFFKKCFIE